ncbi:ABC transporter permease [Paenibacillus oenotherae]|uniref:ABC transporter permease n=1 Tax=Paenibacillus oenotherae TaxID=1435645 RepID=A0ABS7D941_9BACL|nr:ABC transporter permease [Paenibacillus oenotherae]MBW7476385.1 ABC transporter permease [Paenibacillus oenotherae]
MLKLIGLELKKGNLGWYWKGALIATLVIIVSVGLLPYVEETESQVFSDMAGAFMAIGTFVRATFIVFAAVLVAKLIIDEYKSKTITVLFTYPINRTRLMLSKILIISVVTFLSVVISNIIVVCGFLITNHYMHYVSDPLTADFLIEETARMLLYAVSAAGMGLIPIYFGMRKKSVPATIVSSILVVAIFNSNNPGFTLSSFIAIPLAVAAIGFLFAFWSIRNIEHRDIA